MAEFERELISERTLAGLASARGRNGGRPYKMTPAKLRLAMASMGKPGSELCTGLGITRQTLYRHVSPHGELRAGRRKAAVPVDAACPVRWFPCVPVFVPRRRLPPIGSAWASMDRDALTRRDLETLQGRRFLPPHIV